MTPRLRLPSLVLLSIATLCLNCGGTTEAAPVTLAGDSGTHTDASLEADSVVVSNDASNEAASDILVQEAALDTGIEAAAEAAVEADAASITSCNTAADCQWSEFDHDILTPKDCICLFGCPTIPLNKTTAELRQNQYNALCDPEHDGNGNPCPIDDCFIPPPPVCNSGQCTPPTDN